MLYNSSQTFTRVDEFDVTNPNQKKIDDLAKRLTARRLQRAQRLVLVAALLMVALTVFLSFQREQKSNLPDDANETATLPFSAELAARQAQQSSDFEQILIDNIRSDGYMTVTVHAALSSSSSNKSDSFHQADQPETNLVWGALYGIDTHFPNAAKWQRILSDDGDGTPHILRRSIFKKTSRPTEHWAARGITEPFDVYVLALAWHGEHAMNAMQAPVRDAACHIERIINADGRRLRFGGDSVILGYAGENALLDEYVDPIAAAHPCKLNEIRGIFYLCSRSAVVLHMPMIDAGFHSVLFTRDSLPPEAYTINGIMDALLIGDLDRGFTDSAAAQYQRYQKGVGMEKARALFYR